jgi:hypothetical protein
MNELMGYLDAPEIAENHQTGVTVQKVSELDGKTIRYELDASGAVDIVKIEKL